MDRVMADRVFFYRCFYVSFCCTPQRATRVTLRIVQIDFGYREGAVARE